MFTEFVHNSSKKGKLETLNKRCWYLFAKNCPLWLYKPKLKSTLLLYNISLGKIPILIHNFYVCISYINPSTFSVAQVVKKSGLAEVSSKKFEENMTNSVKRKSSFCDLEDILFYCLFFTKNLKYIASGQLYLPDIKWFIFKKIWPKL